MRRCGRGFCAVAIAVLLAGMVGTPARAASTFVAPQFQDQWQQGEAVTPNFWGPLALAKEGQQEPYREASRNMRLVQYFDKARMELTNGKLTNGLLTVELMSGRLQLGDATFEQRTPARINVAGDPGSDGITYADLTRLPYKQGRAYVCASPAQCSEGEDRGNPIAPIFQRYIDRVGLPSVGLPLTGPFNTTVAIGGVRQQVWAQAFERRVLTLAGDSPNPRVEFGNIGQHYYTWRYGSGTVAPVAVAPIAAMTAPMTVPVATTAPTSALAVTFTNVTSPIQRGLPATASVQTAAGAACSIVVTYATTVSMAQGLGPKIAGSDGTVSWLWLVGGNTTPGEWPIDVTCRLGGQSASKGATFTVTAKN